MEARLYILWEGVGHDTPLHEDPVAVAQAISADPHWHDLPPGTLLVRSGSRPCIALIIESHSGIDRRLIALREQLARPLPARCLSWADVEHAAEAMAERIVAATTAAELQDACFVALPRGGLIVMGMLAYLLGLSAGQLSGKVEPDRLLVLVDDTALTGMRAGRYVRSTPAAGVLFAPLVSHADLRAAMVAAEPALRAVVSGYDLIDHAPALLGERHAGWQHEHRQALPPPRYWVGIPDHVSFPWTEPDRGAWNPATGLTDRAWRLTPPGKCLRNRVPSAPGRCRILVHASSGRRYRPAPHVLAGDDGAALLVADLGSRECFRLEGVARAMWHGLLEEDADDDVVAAITAEFDAEPSRVSQDLGRFRDQLISDGLLVPSANGSEKGP
jgi:hypothetical protein